MDKAIVIPRNNHNDSRGSHIKFLGDNVTGDVLGEYKVVESFMTFNHKNTLRGMHFQDPKPQQKLITPLTGSILVNVINMADPTERINRTIFDFDEEMVFIPAGWALGYRALEEDTRVLYLADAPFDGACDNGIDPFDKDLAIEWDSLHIDHSPKAGLLRATVILSERDQNLQSYAEYLKGRA